MVLGFAVIDTVGAGLPTDTVADCEALPPAPVHVRVKVALGQWAGRLRSAHRHGAAPAAARGT